MLQPCWKQKRFKGSWEAEKMERRSSERDPGDSKSCRRRPESEHEGRRVSERW